MILRPPSILCSYTKHTKFRRLLMFLCATSNARHQILEAHFVVTKNRLYIDDCGVATISRIDVSIGLFFRILSLQQGSFAKETYSLIDPANQSHPILIFAFEECLFFSFFFIPSISVQCVWVHLRMAIGESLTVEVIYMCVCFFPHDNGPAFGVVRVDSTAQYVQVICKSIYVYICISIYMYINHVCSSGMYIHTFVHIPYIGRSFVQLILCIHIYVHIPYIFQ